MSDSKAREIIDRFRSKQAARETWESHWQEIAELVFTKQADFTARRTPGEKRETRVFDSTAPQALQNFAATAVSYTAPQTERWHALRHPSDQAMEVQPIAEFYEAMTETLFRYRYSGRSAFPTQLYESFMSMGAFGTGPLWIGSDDRAAESPIWYRSVPMSEAYIAENAQGKIDQLDRKFEYTARQAVQMFGDRVPEAIRRAATTEPLRRFTFLHCVGPNGEYEHDKADRRGMPIGGTVVCYDEPAVVEESGFRKFPYVVGRYVTAANEVYGRSPAMTVLPSIKMLNAMMRSIIRSAELIAEPPLLLAKDGGLTKFQMGPRALNYGGIDQQGRALVQALQTGAQPGVTMELVATVQQEVKAAFLMNLFQILVQKEREQTAFETMVRDQEKGALMGPQLGRLTHDMFGPMIEREIDILAHKRLLPPPPPELAQFGASYEVEYSSPLTRAQQAGDAVALQQVLQDILPLTQVDETILQRFDTDKLLPDLSKIRGMPIKWLRSEEEMEEIAARRAEAEAMATGAAAAPAVSGAIKDLAQAQKFSADARAVGV